ncbi:hypothetical protein [Demequina aurantiaca]|uniref:hypothetical protein n=1 Tax=Demequina aurantiaca TaxID=676200 RepID=UPI0007819B17|nr:hypothetical protein [Demequina aurantiaca]
MKSRIKVLGLALSVIGLLFMGGGVFAYTMVADGQHALQSFSEAQNVTLTYNEDGQLVDRGEVAGAEAILDLLENDWGYAVVASDLDPNDPLVNTGTEYMYQMALIAHHTLTGTNTVVLTEDTEYNGETFPAGTYEVATDGKYWTDFDRSHPLEGPAREMAWTGTAHGLVGELGVGSVTASTLQLGLGIVALIEGLGLVFIGTGLALIWVAAGDRKKELKEAPAIESIDEPATV